MGKQNKGEEKVRKEKMGCKRYKDDERKWWMEGRKLIDTETVFDLKSSKMKKKKSNREIG